MCDVRVQRRANRRHHNMQCHSTLTSGQTRPERRSSHSHGVVVSHNDSQISPSSHRPIHSILPSTCAHSHDNRPNKRNSSGSAATPSTRQPACPAAAAAAADPHSPARSCAYRTTAFTKSDHHASPATSITNASSSAASANRTPAHPSPAPSIASHRHSFIHSPASVTNTSQQHIIDSRAKALTIQKIAFANSNHQSRHPIPITITMLVLEHSTSTQLNPSSNQTLLLSSRRSTFIPRANSNQASITK